MHVLHIHVTYKVVWKSEMVGRLYFLNILQCIYIYINLIFNRGSYYFWRFCLVGKLLSR